MAIWCGFTVILLSYGPKWCEVTSFQGAVIAKGRWCNTVDADGECDE